ncbi:hypothetical protein [Mucilaginibacter sp. FT3.2]|uniref:hypothetical protein n=1 Tax=Mucilaginibacter sp. FT3.2 TaxID=2723090 RepID=UPI001613C47C|nr:hypothetical protein [Mucilaginibacter sp. FT3.2]MBB6232177.1 hypothetical protein [Mucilaginibacter sp. FT3.2]
MKPLLLTPVLLLSVCIFKVNAQSNKQLVKNKLDSAKNATVNGAINDPVGSVKGVMGLFGHKQKTVANATVAAPAAAAPVSSVGGPVNNTSTPSAPLSNNVGLITGNSKNINNGLVFSIIQCTGDKASQVITITYTISNPAKANQNLLVGSLNAYSNNNPGFAIDENGSKLSVGSISMGNGAASQTATELPTGIKIKGYLTLINALPTSSNLQYFKLPIVSANAQGNGDRQATIVEERNIPVTWIN